MEMKVKCIVFSMVLAMVMYGGSVFACNTACCGGSCDNTNNQNFVQSDSTNNQDQHQGNWGSVEDGSTTGGVFQGQTGSGDSWGNYGGGASESQQQGGHINLNTGNTGFDSVSNTYGGSHVSETASGYAGHNEAQTINNAAQVFSNQAGTHSSAGSVMGVTQDLGVEAHMCTGGCAESNVGAVAGAETHNVSGYVNENIGATSGITQYGQQQNDFVSQVHVDGNGYANGSLVATQEGGTGASNNGAGTQMDGAGHASGTISVETNTGCNGVADIGGSQHQIHGYTQYSGNDNQGQWASGVVESSQNTNPTCTNVGCNPGH